MNARSDAAPDTPPRLLPIVYCYSGARWNNSFPGRQFALMREMAAHTQVFFLNDPVIKGYVAEFRLPTAERICEGLTVIHNAFTFRASRSGKHLGPAAAWPDSLVFHRLLRQLGVDEYIYWVASPRRSLLYGLHTDHLVYDCIDPAPETAGHNQLHATETWFAHRAKLVLCSAENLQQRLRQENPRCELVCNAAVVSERAPANAQPLPPELANLRRPIAGVIGTVDFRIDYALLTAAAKRLPDITFLLIGHIAASGAGIAELRAQPNVVLAGEVAADRGTACVDAFAVGLVPFLTGTLGDGINPVKMYTYLASGKPVVSTWMQECRRHAPLVTATNGLDDFVAAIEQEIRTDSPEKAAARVAFARRNTWRERAREAAAHLRNAGLVMDK